MYEHKRQPLATKKTFYKRVAWNVLIATGVLIVSLLIGIVGYHYTANIPWLDSLHNASMILSGMGPVITIETTEGKWFSSIYAIFCGVVFISNIGIILAPTIHRIMHRLHMDEQE